MRPTYLGLALLASVALGCEPSDPLGRSCGGSSVELCGPSEWAELPEASFEPDGLVVSDFSESATIRVALERCEDAPAPHAVELEALYTEGTLDGGPAMRIVGLLTLREGEDGDAPGDDVIELEVTNPLIAPVPADSDITLRFRARSTTPGGCSSGTIEIPYRTGRPPPEP